MKTRHGFVSNSSSSSFIIGLAKVADENVAKEWLSKMQVSGYDCSIGTVESFQNNWRVNVSSVYNAERDACDRFNIRVESFNGDTVELMNLAANDLVLLADLSCGDDSDFWNGDEYDYDIDLDFFPPDYREVYRAITNGSNGVEPGRATFGAGRDG